MVHRTKNRLPRETFGMRRDRGFSLAAFCDPCKKAARINLSERGDLADRRGGTVDFKCRRCGCLGHYRLEPALPHREAATA